MKKTTLTIAAILLCAGLTACGAKNEETAAVQSVSALCGYGPVGLAQRFAGVVTSRSQIEVEKEYEKEIKDILVAVGDEVTVGQVLFTYDSDTAEMELERAKLDLEQLKNSLDSQKKQKESLEKEKAKASADQKLSYTLEIQETEANIAETTYNIAVKEKEIAKQAEGLKHLDVKSTVNGIVIAINENGETDDYGMEKPFMTISETGNYRVKGYINETNRDVLYEGTPVILRSRMDEASWTGTISMIDWENPAQNGNYYGYSNEVGQSSKYPFYVELDDIDGLLMGQHVYVEPDFGQDEEVAAEVTLSEWYINDLEGKPWVWAESKSGKLEKRNLELGEYDAELGTYIVLNGIGLDDYICAPDESLKEGMTCVEYDGVAGGDIEFEPGYDGGDYIDDGMMEGGMYEDGMIEEGVYEEGSFDEGFYDEGMEDGMIEDMPEDGGYDEGENLEEAPEEGQ